MAMSEDQQATISVLYVGGDSQVLESLSTDPLLKVSSAENGYLAISRLDADERPDVIVSELILPGMSGYALYEEFRQKFVNQLAVFILVDAGSDREERMRAIKAGVDDLIRKPLDMVKFRIRTDFLMKFRRSQSVISILESKQEKVRIPLEKRIFDILFASAALVMLSPLLLIVAAAIRIESKGKVFYAAKRVGAGYTIFPFFKFRSMFTGADARLKELKHLNQYAEKDKEEDALYEECPECSRLGKPCSTLLYIREHEVCERQYLQYKRQKLGKTFNKIKNDPRVTKVGRLIRKTSIDELPQLFNVLRGEMSIVGNRPVPLYEAELLTSDSWTERFLAPAGITGLWQVSKRGKSDMSNEERKALDNEYARNYSFWKDMIIILRTFTAFMQKEDV